MDFKLLAILMFVVLHTSSATNTTELVTTANYPLGNKILSRKRRFISTTGWTFKVTLDLSIPMEGLGSSLGLSLPFTYAFDTGR